MKWFTRMPSLHVHFTTAIVCVVVLVSLSVLVGAVRKRYTIPNKPSIVSPTSGRVIPQHSVPWPICYVTLVDERVQLFGDGHRPSEKERSANLMSLWEYRIYAFPSGSLAPVRLEISHHLRAPMSRLEAHPEAFQSFSQRWELGLTPDEEGYLAVNERVTGSTRFRESRIIWSGYVINTASMLAIVGSLWTAAWLPRQFRYQIQLRRYHLDLCPLCKYDVRATPGKCPECGWGQEGEGNGDVSGGNEV